ncbi:hypothetical protein [Azospirillum thiophilum]|uniref:hypothetical protein n=1 Tax=Azospirillum thiophilum TaxID=528244 RepID=UPI000AA06F55|nr:hypothetical protein [Azospirillum thiophilum]
METPPRHSLSDAKKGTLLLEQAVLIERLAARITELEDDEVERAIQAMIVALSS